MFYGCKKLNVDLSKWKFNRLAFIPNMFNKCTSMKKIPSWYKE